MLKVMNPATEEVLKDIPVDNGTSIASKFKSARLAQHEWAMTKLTTRLEIMQRFHSILEKDKEELAKILTAEVGKPISQARNEIAGTLTRLAFFLEKTPQVLRDETVLSDQANRMNEVIAHEPLGVVANISAWNYPYFVGSNVFVPALLAGNAVLYKPSEFASLTGLAIADRLHKSGIPKEVFVPVIGDGSVGAELLKQPLQGVFFTGSHATGTRIAESAAKGLMKVQLELGGKDPVYVCDDVDVDVAAVAAGVADGAFYNTGQSCCSVERIYVHEKIFNSFVEHFVTTVKSFVMGDPMDDQTYIGAMTRPAQLKILEQQIQDAVKKGAKLLCGGKRKAGKGSFFEPAVLVDVNHDMELMREESFGPVIGIQKVKNDDEALRLMNDTFYGLTASVYSPNEERAKKILKEVNAGSVYWNCCDRVSPRLPWSGRGRSGIGLTLSTLGILAFTQPKAWHLRGS